MTAVSFAGGDLEATVDGGPLLSVVSLRHRGEEVLVAPADLPVKYCVHGQRAGITLLHPWANRLGADQYAVGGVPARVPAADGAIARDPRGLAIHGLLAPLPWVVEPRGDDGAVAYLDFPGHPAFPFPHACTVTFALGGGALEVGAQLRATADVAVPLSVGWHPYFTLPGVARAEWGLALPERRHLALDDRGIPDGQAAQMLAESAPLASRTFDDGYDGIADGAVFALEGGGRRIAVTHGEGYAAAQVFAPPDADVVSLEPMAAITDALRSGEGLRSVAPGEAARMTFTVAVG